MTTKRQNPENIAIHGGDSRSDPTTNTVAVPILSHRIVKNYKAEAENISIVDIIESLL